ncbi:hypothetical protein APY03_7048 [Variovorax sp. WDL1]|nr:hypothetical protein APY03_7048 [Variovorax sp. WDL1]
MLIGQRRSLCRSLIERTSIRPALDVRHQDVETARDTLILEQVTDSFNAFAGERQLQRLILRRRFICLQG